MSCLTAFLDSINENPFPAPGSSFLVNMNTETWTFSRPPEGSPLTTVLQFTFYAN